MKNKTLYFVAPQQLYLLKDQAEWLFCEKSCWPLD